MRSWRTTVIVGDNKKRKQARLHREMFRLLASAWNHAMSLLAAFCSKVTLPAHYTDDREESIDLMYSDATGIVQAIRQTLWMGGVPFTESRLPSEQEKSRDHSGHKQALRIGQGTTITTISLRHETSALRYASRLARTYPAKDALAATIVDQWVEMHTEFLTPFRISMDPHLYGVQVETSEHRLWCANVHLNLYFTKIERELATHEWLGGMTACSMADICWYQTLAWLHEENFEGVEVSHFLPFPSIREYILRMRKTVEEDDDYSTDDEREEDGSCH